MNTENIKLFLKYAEHNDVKIKSFERNHKELFLFCNHSCGGCIIYTECIKSSYFTLMKISLNKEELDFLKQDHPECFL